MKIKCNKCNTEYNIDSSRIGPSGIKIKCPKCLNSFLVKKDGSISNSSSSTSISSPSKAPAPDKTVNTNTTTSQQGKVPIPPAPKEPDIATTPPEKTTKKSPLSLENLPDLPDLPELPELGTDTDDLLNTLNKEIGTTSTSSNVQTQKIKEQDTSSSGLDFGMVNLDDAIAKSINTDKSPPDKPKAAPLDIRETKLDSVQAPIDQTTSFKQAQKKYKVKRKSGKIFGPFDEETIIRMLVENKLLGNEEVSEDNINWQSISKIPEFQRAIQNMLENISHSPPPAARQPEKPAQERPKLEEKKKVDVKKEGVKEPTKIGEFRELFKEKIQEFRERFNILPVKIKKSIFVGLTLVAILISGFTGYKIYSKIFGSKLTDEQQKIITTTYNALLSGNNADITMGYNSLKELYTKLSYKTPVCVLLTRIILYHRLFATEALEKDSDDYLRNCNNAMEKENLGTPDSLFALGIYYSAYRNQDKIKIIQKDLNSSPHYQSYINAIINISNPDNRNFAQAITDFETYLKGTPQDSLTMAIIGELYRELKNKEEAKKWFKKAVDTNPKNYKALIEYLHLISFEEEDHKNTISTLENLLSSQSNSIHPIEISRAELVLAKIYFAIRKNEEAEKYFKSAIVHSNGRIDYRYSYAEFLYNTEELDRAFDEYNAIIKQSPDNVEANLGLVKIMIKQRKILNGHKTIMQLYAQNQSNPYVILYKGKIEEEFEKFSEAAQSYNQILSLNKDFIEAKLALANLLIRQNKIEEGLNLLEGIKKDHPQNVDVLSLMGKTYLNLKKFDLATENLRHIIEIDNYNTYARFLLARAYIEKQDYEEALKHLEVVKMQISKMPELRLYFGKVYFGLKKYPEAIKYLEEELKTNKQSIDAMILLGNSYSMNNDHQKAIEILNNAITLENNNAIAYFHLGMAYLRKGDKSSAVESFKSATNKSKENIEFRFIFGKTMIENNMFSEGIEELKNVIKKAPDNPEYRYHLGMGYYLAKSYKAAIAEFLKVNSLDPENESALFYIGKSQQSRKEYEKAIKSFKKCIEKNENNDKALYEIARTYELMEKYDQAIDYYQKTISKNKMASMAYYRLGYIYKGKNNYKKAISFFTQFLQISPEDDLAQEVKDEIFDLNEILKDSEEEEKAAASKAKNKEEEEE